MPSVEEYEKDIARQAELYAEGKFDSHFKYCSDKPEVIDGIFNRQVIRFTQPRALNDPLEFSPTMRFKDAKARYRSYDLNGVHLPSVEFFFRVQIIESQVNAYGILSLTKIPNSFDMWSHYANGHRGFVLEFKDQFWQHHSMKSKMGAEYPVGKVEYVEDYSINLENLADSNKEIPTAVLHKELFFKKTSRWEYEHEYRMVRPLSDSPDYLSPKSNFAHIDTDIYLFPYDWECVSSVILGANMSSDNKQLIARHTEKFNTPVHQAHIIRDIKDWYGRPCTVYISSLDQYQSKEIILQAEPQLLCTDTVSLGNQSTINISDIADLPYYKDNKEVVEQLYNNLKTDYHVENKSVDNL